MDRTIESGIRGIQSSTDAQLLREARRFLQRFPNATLYELARELGLSAQEAGTLARAAAE